MLEQAPDTEEPSADLLATALLVEQEDGVQQLQLQRQCPVEVVAATPAVR